MYHGTVAAYLPEIQSEGLKPSKGNAWRITLDDGSRLRDREKVTAVFLTPSKSHAIQYAQTKAKYLSVAPGDGFEMYGSPMEFWKDKGAQQLQTAPVLLTVDVPEDLKHIRRDPQDPLAIRWIGDIAPDRIKAVKTLPMMY
jgi:hypothetical protein